MKKLTAVLIGGILLASCTKPKDLEFVDVQNIRMISFGLSESQIGLDLRLYNPNNQRVSLKDVEAKVYANSAFLGDTHTDTTISVPKKDTFAIPLILNVKTGTALTRALQTFSDSTITIRVEGNVKMGKAGVFVNYPIRYEQKQTLSELNLNF